MTEPARKRRTWLGVTGSLLVIAGAIAYSYWLPRTWVMEGPSMEPALMDGDRFVYLATAPALGEVVVLDSPSDGVRVVKRVVGMPGDRIELREGVLVRNGRVVTGSPRPASSSARVGRLCAREQLGVHRYDISYDTGGFPDTHSPVVVPPHHVYVLGDDRDRSNDSRYFGPVAIRRVLGRVAWLSSRVTPRVLCP